MLESLPGGLEFMVAVRELCVLGRGVRSGATSSGGRELHVGLSRMRVAWCCLRRGATRGCVCRGATSGAISGEVQLRTGLSLARCSYGVPAMDVTVAMEDTT
jgi:hypothetical protein